MNIKILWMDIKYISQPRKRLFNHILNDHMYCVEKMIQNGVDPNPTPEEMGKHSNLFWPDWGELHCPPLFAAVRSGSVSMVELLLKHTTPSIGVPRSRSTMIYGVQGEDVWHINAVDYLIEFARGQPKLSGPKVLRWGEKTKPKPINPVEAKIQDYLEIYKRLRLHMKPGELSKEWLNNAVHQRGPLSHFKILEEEEILHEQNRRIFEHLEPKVSNISRKI